MPIETEHKWLVNSFPQIKDYPRGVTPHISTITQVYLTPTTPGTVERLRHRFHRTQKRHVYTHTVKAPLGRGSSEEDERDITVAEFADRVREQEHPEYKARTKYRTVFEWDGLTWELDEFQNGLGLLELEVPELIEGVELPPWVKMGAEVTGNALYANAVIARRSWNSEYPTRADFIAAVRQRVQWVLSGFKGLGVTQDESSHNEWWYRTYDGEDGLFVRFRDACDSPQDDFHLSCMVGRGEQSLSFWHEDQGGRSVHELALAITEHLRVEGLRDGWFREEDPSSLLSEASDAVGTSSSHEPLRQHPAYQRLIARGPEVAPDLYAYSQVHLAVLGRGSRMRGGGSPQDPPPGPVWAPLIALRDIFGDEGPTIPPEHDGKLDEIHRAWWRWGDEKGLTSKR